MSLATLTQDPSERLDYDLDWRSKLVDRHGSVVESIASATWATSDEDLVIGEDEYVPQVQGTLTKVWLELAADVEAGQTYTVTCTMTTSGGRIFERSFELRFEEK